MVISFSKMQPIRRFGLITALALVVSLFASLLVLPSIITLIARRHASGGEDPEELTVACRGGTFLRIEHDYPAVGAASPPGAAPGFAGGIVKSA